MHFEGLCRFKYYLYAAAGAPADAIHSKDSCFVAFLQHEVRVQEQQNLLDKVGFSKLWELGCVFLRLVSSQVLPHACACIQQQDQYATLTCALDRC